MKNRENFTLNLFQQVQHHAQINPRKIALWHFLNQEETLAITFHQLAIKAHYFATAFQTSFPETSIIPMYLSKSFDGVAAMLGAIGTGKAFACLNRKLSVSQINTIINDTTAPLGLIDGAGAIELQAELLPGMPVTQIQWWLLPEWNFTRQSERAVDKMRKLGVEVNTWPLEHATISPLPLLEDDPQRVGCCLFTSGSTGAPKGVLIAEQDLRNRAMAEIALFELKQDDILLNILPFSFDVGLNQLLSTLTVGCSLVLLDSWQSSDVLKSVEKFKVTGISGVPSIWRDLVNSGLRFDTKTTHASLRYITISGGDLAPQHLDLIPQIIPHVRIFKTYGQTESFRSTALHPSDFQRKKGSVGKLFDKVHLYIVRENGSLCDRNEVGEIVHTGLGTMLGYLNNENAQDKLRPNPFFGNEDHSPHAIFTGDLGYLDEEGYLFLKGRRDAMLKIADNKTYPQEISDQILKIKEVREAEVVGIRTAEGHTILFAFVVLKENATLDSEEIRRQLITQLPSYMVPREIVILTAIPRTSSAKTDYPFLAKYARKLLSTVKNVNNGN